MADLPLTVIIVTYNSRHEIGECLNSLLADLGERSHQVIVVDNASSDGTPVHVTAGWPQVTLIAQNNNQGFAKANNIGLAAASGDPILFLNPDTVIQSGAIAALEATLNVRRDVGVVGPMLLNPDGSLQPSCREFPNLLGHLIGMAELYRIGAVRHLLQGRLVSLSDHRTARRADWLSGACLLVRRAAINAVGPMNESFFMYSEEMEWQYRMVQCKWYAQFEPAARVTHLGGASTAAVPRQRIVWQYQSLYRFYRIYHSMGQRLALRLLVWAITAPKILLLVLTSHRNPRRQELLGAFWQVLWLH